MAQKQFKIGLSNTDKQNMAQDVYERLLALTFPEYETTESYEVGDFVVYNDQLYKCIGATSGAWDSTKWQLATLNDLLTDIESAVAFVNDKANVDGNYPTMTVGAADNLTPYDEDSGVDQEQPFLLQGTGCGNGEQQVDTGALGLLKEKQGNTVVVNQHIQNGDFSNGLTNWNAYSGTGSVSNNTLTVTGAVGRDGVNYIGDSKTIGGHKYLFSWEYTSTVDAEMQYALLTYSICPATNSFTKKFALYEPQQDETYGIRFDLFPSENGVSGDLQLKNCFCVDLTQWFGSNDNIPAHLLAHPEDFFRYYQGSLAYNEGTLVNANGRYLKTIGRNQWDEEWELGTINQETGGNQSSSTAIRSKNYIKVIPNTDYYFKHPDLGFRLLFYDKDYNMIENKSQAGGTTVTTPSNCCYIRFYLGSSYGTTYNNDITISIYYDGESGYDQYYPYEELANIDTGNEVLRSAGSVKDSKAPDGTIHRLVGNREYQSGDENDSSLTTDGTTTNYPLETPTTEQGASFSENVAIDDFGSMDFGGTNGVPQGALIFYPVDYKAFVDTLYKYTDGTASNIALKSDLSSFLTQQDLSSGITDVAEGIDFAYRKIIKIGNVVNAVISLRNTSSGISANSTLFKLPSGSFNATTGNIFNSFKTDGTAIATVVDGNGNLQLKTGVDTNVWINISFSTVV